MTRNIEDIFDEMDDQLDEARAFPLTGGKSLVDIDPLRDCIEEARICLPLEIKQAKAIVADRADIISAAKKEAEEIIARAEKRAQAMVAADEITRRAQEQGNQILTEAQTRARETTRAAADYIENIITKTEECFGQSLTEVKRLHQAFRSHSGANK